MIEFRWLECDDKDLGAVHIEGPNGSRDYYAKLQCREVIDFGPNAGGGGLEEIFGVEGHSACYRIRIQ